MLSQVGEKITASRKAKKLTQPELAEQMTAYLRDHFPEIKEVFTQPKISSLEKEKQAATWVELFSIANALGTFVSDIINPMLPKLADFEVRMRHLEDCDSETYLLELEKSDRFCIFADFPSAIYTFKEPPKEDYQLHRKVRYQQFRDKNSRTIEYYTIYSLFNFVFSPLSRFTPDEKIEVLDNIENMFKLNRINMLHFFSSETLPVIFSNMELINHKNTRYTILMYSPISKNTYIEINNKSLYDSIYKNFMDETKYHSTDNKQSILILSIVRDFLMRRYESYTQKEILDLYNTCPADIQSIIMTSFPLRRVIESAMQGST